MSVSSIIDEAEKHFAAIGKLCASWALLDRELNRLLAVMLNCDAKQIAAIATQVDNVAARCRLIRHLIYTIPGQKWWRDDFEKVLTIIEQKISAKRNRYVHDSWTVDDEKMWVKTDRRSKLETVQKINSKILTFDDKQKVARDEIGQLNHNVIVAMICIHDIIDDIGCYSKLDTMRKEESELLIQGGMEMFQNL